MVNVQDNCHMCGLPSTNVLSCAMWLLRLIKYEILVMGKVAFSYEKNGGKMRGRERERGGGEKEPMAVCWKITWFPKHWWREVCVYELVGYTGSPSGWGLVTYFPDPFRRCGYEMNHYVPEKEMPPLLSLPVTPRPHEKENAIYLTKLAGDSMGA